MRAVLTRVTRTIEHGEQIEGYRINRKLYEGLDRMVDGDDVVVQTGNGTKVLEHKYCLARVWKDDEGRRFAEFAVEEEASDEIFGGLIRADVSIALGELNDVEIKWRGWR